MSCLYKILIEAVIEITHFQPSTVLICQLIVCICEATGLKVCRLKAKCYLLHNDSVNILIFSWYNVYHSHFCSRTHDQRGCCKVLYILESLPA